VNRGVNRVRSDRGSVFLEYALLSSVIVPIAISVFTPLIFPDAWAGAYFGDDFMIRDALIKLPFF